MPNTRGVGIEMRGERNHRVPLSGHITLADGDLSCNCYTTRSLYLSLSLPNGHVLRPVKAGPRSRKAESARGEM